MTPQEETTRAHLLKSSPETFDIDADFAADMRRYRKTALEREAERQAVEVEPHEFHGVPLADVLREDERSEVDYPGMWK